MRSICPQPIQRRWVWLALCICVASFVVGLDNTALFFQDDEWLYMKIASEMYDRGELWVPYWIGERDYHKPPLSYWLMMLLFPLGDDRVALARLSVSLTTLVTAWLIYWSGKKLYGKDAGLTASLLALSTFGFIAFGRVGVMDMLLTCCMTATMAAFIKTRQDNSPFGACLFIFLLGFSTLVKGPIAPVIMGVCCGTLALLFRVWKPFLTRWTLLGMFAGAAAIALWPVALYLKGEFPAWYDFFIKAENLSKFSDSIAYPALPFISHLLRWLLPWTFLFLASIGLLLRREHFTFAFAAPVVWILSIIGVHLLPETRLPWYMFPAVPPAVLLLGAILTRHSQHLLVRCGYTITALLFGLVALLMLLPLKFFSLASLSSWLIAGVSLSFGVASYVLLRRNIIFAVASVSLAILLLMPVSAQLVDPRFPLPARQILAASDRPVFVARLQTGRLSQQHAVFSFYLNRQIAQAHSSKAIVANLNDGHQLIISETDWQQLKKEAMNSLPVNLQIKYSWNQWQENLPAETIRQAWDQGRIDLLQEPYHIIGRP